MPAALAAKAATATIPIVFSTNADPVQFGLVASLSRPGGKLTGVTSLNVEVGPKRLELLHEAVPAATLIGLLLNPTNPLTEAFLRDHQAAARILGVQLHVLYASNELDIDAAFATLVQLRAGGLVIGQDAFFANRTEQLTALALRHAVPTIFQTRAFVAAGGLMSYGGNVTETGRLAGMYTGRILKGEKPGDLPVQQAFTTRVLDGPHAPYDHRRKLGPHGPPTPRGPVCPRGRSFSGRPRPALCTSVHRAGHSVMIRRCGTI
jgi:putative ABC transport system substrate-binding protein